MKLNKKDGLAEKYLELFCEATNFTRLANSVFRACGGLKTNYISKSGKNLIMYRAICECRDKLTEYKIALGHEKGCIKSFLEAIGELKSYSVTVGALEKAIDELDNESLKNRLRDIITIWSSYEAILSERFSDPYDDIGLLAKAISENEINEKKIAVLKKELEELKASFKKCRSLKRTSVAVCASISPVCTA